MWNEGKFSILTQASLFGVGRGLIGLPFEHPLDTIKTHLQLRGSEKATEASVRQVSREIFLQKGWQGFYAGFWPNVIRVSSKQFYRMPLTLGLSEFFKKKIVQLTGTQYPILSPIFTGLSLASLETFIICPLERTKVWLMTHQGQDGWQALKQNVRSKSLTELFRGLNAVYAKQMSSWMSFLIAEEVFRDMARRYTHTDNLSLTSLMFVSLGVGGVNTLAAYPFDMVKTLQQKSQSPVKKQVWSTLSHLFKNQGFRGMYAGWRARIVQYMVQSFFTVNFLDQFRQRLNQLDK